MTFELFLKMTEVLRHDYKMGCFYKKTTKVKIVSTVTKKVQSSSPPQPPSRRYLLRLHSSSSEDSSARRFKLDQTYDTIPAARRLKRWQHEAAPLPLPQSTSTVIKSNSAI